MGKITLALESLAVESFATMPAEGATGTVVAHQLLSNGGTCVTCARSCWNTCAATCPDTCVATCGVSCFGTCDLTACGGCYFETRDPYNCWDTAQC